MLRRSQWISQRTCSRWRSRIARDASSSVRLTRRQFERFLETLTDDLEVVMESCGTSHYWGRRLQSRGVHVRLLPVQYVRRTCGETRRTGPTPMRCLRPRAAERFAQFR